MKFVFDGCPYLTVFIVRLGFDGLNRRSAGIDRDSLSCPYCSPATLYPYHLSSSNKTCDEYDIQEFYIEWYLNDIQR